MAVITPQTDVYLLKCPLEISDINQLTFANATAQFNYFNSLPKLSVDNFTYQRKDGTIRFGANFDSLVSYNYAMYRNDAYSNKWFYAYIDGMEYLNDNVTAISIKTDVWQTWQFDLEFKSVLIDREHTNNDTVGANTLPEGLELGEFVVNGDTQNFGSINNNNFVTVVDVTMVENPGENQTLSYSFDTAPAPVPTFTPPVNGIPSGTIHLLLGYDQYNHRVNTYYDPSVVTTVYNNAGLSDAIVNMYILPAPMIDTSYIYGGLNISSTYTPPGGSPVTKTAPNLAIFAGTFGATDLGSSTFTKPTTLDGYTPKNSKLKTFPFIYFNISNNAGSSFQYRYEDFSSTVNFKMEGAFCASGSIKAIPQNYKNISSSENAYDYSVNGAKLPILSWSSDSYTNWLTQNSVNITMNRESTVRKAIGEGIGSSFSFGLLPGLALGGASLVGGTLANAREELRAKSNANLVADQVHGNINAGDIVWAKYRSQFTYLPMSIKAEYARCIDEYFSTYGYKCNRVKVPNITGRRNWNYVKTVGCYIEADIPQDDLAEIKSMFDKGITLWHNPSTFMDYSQANDII